MRKNRSTWGRARWLIAGLALALMFALATASSSAAVSPRLAGTFLMLGKLTDVHNVKGEHRGQRVQRTWFFVPRCPSGSCQRVTLVRRRSGKLIRDVLVLKHRRPNVYAGTGRFWVALKCAGQLIQHGGRATETITVRITRTRVIGTTTFAAGIKANYVNPRRVNLTKCPGGIGHDAATYGGTLTTTESGQPTAGFSVATDPNTLGSSFTDRSTSGPTGAAIVAWSWNFGDPTSASNTSALNNPTHQYSAHGIYTVTLQAQDADGQLATVSQQITI